MRVSARLPELGPPITVSAAVRGNPVRNGLAHGDAVMERRQAHAFDVLDVECRHHIVLAARVLVRPRNVCGAASRE